MKRKKKMKKPKIRNYVSIGHSKRGGAGSGFHSKRKYSRKVKHKHANH
jgi:hypothetical protein